MIPAHANQVRSPMSAEDRVANNVASTGPGLRRSLSPTLLTLYGLGNILGAGIYVLIGKVAATAGVFTPWSFLLASLIAGLSAFSYAELSARYPLSAGEAVYLQEGFGLRQLSCIAGLLIIFAGIVSAAAISRGFVGYFQQFLQLPPALVIGLLVAALGSLAIWGIVESVRVAALFTLAEIAGLLLVVVVAFPESAALSASFSALFAPVEFAHLNGIMLGSILAFTAGSAGRVGRTAGADLYARHGRATDTDQRDRDGGGRQRRIDPDYHGLAGRLRACPAGLDTGDFRPRAPAYAYPGHRHTGGNRECFADGHAVSGRNARARDQPAAARGVRAGQSLLAAYSTQGGSGLRRFLGAGLGTARREPVGRGFSFLPVNRRRTAIKKGRQMNCHPRWCYLSWIS